MHSSYRANSGTWNLEQDNAIDKFKKKLSSVEINQENSRTETPSIQDTMTYSLSHSYQHLCYIYTLCYVFLFT